MELNGNATNDGAPEGRRPEHEGTGTGDDGRSPAAADRMRQVASAAANGRASREELQAAARALVRELRQQQEPPEQVLLQIKSFLADAGLKPGIGAAPSLYRELISCSIRYYYEDGTSRSSGDGTGGSPSGG